jgi:hypothetical protein
MNGKSLNDPPAKTDSKKTSELVRGSLLLILGAWMAIGCIRAVFYILRTQTFGTWFTSDTALRIVAAMFFIWVGARAIRRVGQEVPGTKIGWGRLLLGVVLIYVQIREHFVPNPSALQPDNESQAAGMRAMSVVIYVAGAALIVGSFLKKKQKPVAIVPEEARSVAGQR